MFRSLFSSDSIRLCNPWRSFGQMCATVDIFSHLTHLLMNLAGGKLCAVLEGGYNLTSLSQSVCQTVQTLLGDPAPRPANLDGPCQSALESLHCVRSAHKQYWSCLKHAAELPTSDISTKGIQLAEGEEGLEMGEEEKSVAQIEWPEPPIHVAPPVRTALVLPDGVPCPGGCRHFSSSEDPDLATVSKLRENFLRDADDSDALTALCSVIALVEKMEKNEICSGLALVRDVSMAMMCVVQHAATTPSNRVLVVCVGDAVVPSHGTDDGKTLVVHFNNKESEGQRGKSYIPVCVKKGCSNVSWFTQAVLGLLLPLGYQYDPSLVLLVRMPDCGLCDSMWQQLTGLLQGLAQGHTLVLMQAGEEGCVSHTASVLLGNAAPSLGQLHAPPTEDVEVLERLRHKLQADWTLLQTTAPETGGGGEH